MKSNLLRLLLLMLLPTTALANEQSCKVDLDKLIWTKAEYALSGDTIVIQNQRVRLIGLYAPQKGKQHKFNSPSEPLADEAQLFLNKLLANNDLEVGVEYDQTRIDNRNRQLVHLFLRDGTSVQQQVLENGFALNRTLYNNTKHAKCYYQAELKARKGKYQIWDLLSQYPEAHFPLIRSSEVTNQDQGFRIIRGKVDSVSRSETNYIVNMDTTGIRVPQRHWGNFDYSQLKNLEGKTIEVRGYAYLFNEVMFIILDHPYAIDALNPTNRPA